MKILRFFMFTLGLVFFGVILSCKDSKKETPADDPVETFHEKTVLKSEDSVKYKNALAPIWEYDPDLEIPVKVREIDTETLTAQQLIDILNFQNEGKVYLKYIELSGDTLSVKIDNSTYLTQQMGTTGADSYLSVATYTLTELEYVNKVNFDFVEGDHARPGIYSRDYYVKRNRERVLGE